MAKSILLIGMGNFGQLLGERLMNMGDDVMIVDKDEAVMNRLAAKYSDAMIANCMSIDNLRTFDVPTFDYCIVAIGGDFQSSLEITSNLKELGAKYIISKANSNLHKKFLLKAGADEVIYPNQDVADRISVKLNVAQVFEYYEIDANNSIFEISVPRSWMGKTISRVNPRKGYGINILTIKKAKDYLPTPGPEYKFEAGDHMLVFGNTEKIIAFTNKNKA